MDRSWRDRRLISSMEIAPRYCFSFTDLTTLFPSVVPHTVSHLSLDRSPVLPIDCPSLSPCLLIPSLYPLNPCYISISKQGTTGSNNSKHPINGHNANTLELTTVTQSILSGNRLARAIKPFAIFSPDNIFSGQYTIVYNFCKCGLPNTNSLAMRNIWSLLFFNMLIHTSIESMFLG